MGEIYSSGREFKEIEVILADGTKGTIKDLKGKDVLRITNKNGRIEPISRFLRMVEEDQIEICQSKNCVWSRYLPNISKIEILSASDLLEIIRDFEDKQQKKSQELWG